jgi:hypothetical protein
MPAQDEPKIKLIDPTHIHALPETGTRSEPETQVETLIFIVAALPIHAPDLPQVQKCIFCLADPQGTHKRFDKIEKVNRLKCRKTDHDNFTCGRCTANYHPVAKTTPQLEAHVLPRIILTSPDSKHSSVLESFVPDKNALYPAAKRRGRANWLGYKWIPNVPELKTEKTTQLTKARSRTLRRESRMYGGVQLLATAALASTPVAFFPSTTKVAATTSDGALPMSHLLSANTETAPESSPTNNLLNCNISNDIACQGQHTSPLKRSFADVVRDGGRTPKPRKYISKSQKGGRTHGIQKGSDNTSKFQKLALKALNTANAAQDVTSQMLKGFHAGKSSPERGRDVRHAHKWRGGGQISSHKKSSLSVTSSPSVTFSSLTTRPKLKITFGHVCARSFESNLSDEAVFFDRANGSAAHRPFLSLSVYSLVFTTPSELREDEEPSVPLSSPPSPTSSTISSTSTDSSCVSESEWCAGWDALA